MKFLTFLLKNSLNWLFKFQNRCWLIFCWSTYCSSNIITLSFSSEFNGRLLFCVFVWISRCSPLSVDGLVVSWFPGPFHGPVPKQQHGGLYSQLQFTASCIQKSRSRPSELIDRKLANIITICPVVLIKVWLIKPTDISSSEISGSDVRVGR